MEKNQNSIAVVRPEHMLALQQNIVSSEETRYYLNGVLIEPHKDGGAVMTATDGHIMATVYDPNAFCAGPAQIWRYKDFAAAVKAFQARYGKFIKDAFWLRYQQFESATPDFRLAMSMGADGAEAAQRIWDSRVSGEICEQIGRDTAIDGTFPDYSRVIPTIGETRSATTINSSLIQRIGKFADNLTGQRAKAVNLLFQEETAPGFFLFNHDQVSVVGVVMPMRANAPMHHPSWIADHLNRDDLRPPAPVELINKAKAA